MKDKSKEYKTRKKRGKGQSRESIEMEEEIKENKLKTINKE